MLLHLDATEDGCPMALHTIESESFVAEIIETCWARKGRHTFLKNNYNTKHDGATTDIAPVPQCLAILPSGHPLHTFYIPLVHNLVTVQVGHSRRLGIDLCLARKPLDSSSSSGYSEFLSTARPSPLATILPPY